MGALTRYLTSPFIPMHQWQRQQHRWLQLQQWLVQLQRLHQPPQQSPDGPGQYTHRYVGAVTSIEPYVSSLGACVVSGPVALELLSVGAAATTRLVPAFVAGSGATSPTARLSFTLDSGASSCFFRDCTDLTPLHTPVTVALVDPFVGSVVAESTTTLPCPAAPSEFLTGYHTPSFSRSLVGVSHLHDLAVVTTFPLHEPAASCTRAAPHSSSFPPTTAPLQTLHLDVWGPSLVLGPRQERYFVIVVDKYFRYTTVFPLRRKANVPTILEPWLLATGGVQGLCGLRLHSDRGVRYTVHQLNLWPSDARPRVTPIFLWTGFPGVAADYCVWGSLCAPVPASFSASHSTPQAGCSTTQSPTSPLPIAPPPSRPAPSGVSYVTPQSSPSQRLVRVVSGGAGGAVAEGESTGAAGARRASSGGAGGVRLETTPEEDTPVLTQWPGPASPLGLVRGPLPSPPVPPAQSLSSSQWTRRSPRSRAVSPEPYRSRYRADGPFHLVLRSCVPSPPVLPQPRESSLTALHDPLSDYLRASCPIVSRVFSALVTHPTAPLSSVSALVTTVAGFASSHCLDYAAHLVSDPARSSSSGGALVFPLEGDPDALDIPIPRAHAEAVSGPWASYWIAAEEAEMASYRSTSTYVDAVPPPGANIVSGMWLYKVKQPPGAPPVFKARYVARGFSQREGVEFFQTFAPTSKMTTLRVLLHIAAQRENELHSLDFSTAFLQGSLHEQIWVRRPPGFTGSFPPGTQWQLCRLVYGLRQAPREWHDTLRTTLAALDFFPSSADPSLFVRRGSTPFFVLVYVDDLVFTTPDRRALASVKEELQRRHTCTGLGELQRYLGLQITRDRTARTITLTQSHMVEQIFTRFCFPFSKVQPTPLAVDHGLTALPSDKPFESSGPYPELVGCLMYLTTCTRPDLANPLSILARFVAPGRHPPSHWYATKRVAKYVASTSDMGLVIGGSATRSHAE
ncbi:unnamed protein product [Closterium sp. NIES-54]